MKQKPLPSSLDNDFHETSILTGSQVSKEYLSRMVNTFLRVDTIMSTITDLRELLGLIMLESKDLVNAESSSLMLYDQEHEELYFEVALGPKGDEVKEIRLKLNEGIAGYAATSGETVNVADAHKDPRFLLNADEKTGYVTRSILAVPVRRKEKLIGILEVLNKQGGGEFSEEDAKILEVLAHQAGIAIENARLFEANVRAERLAAIGEAIAGMAHCVKNILAGMQGSSSLVEVAVKEKRYNILPKAWDILKKSSDKVASLVQNMLSYSKERQPVKKPSDINMLVCGICEIQHRAAEEEGIGLELSTDPDLPLVALDKQAIERCIQNLVLNAIDAITEARIDMDIDGRVKVITRKEPKGNGVQIVVSDNGCGIPEDELPKIYNAFYSTKGSGGTGLGLSVTAKIVREHGGRIEVESELMRGTTFLVTLPVSNHSAVE